MNSTSIVKMRKDLEEAQKDLQSREQKLRKAEAKVLQSLPARAGMRSVDELIKALLPHASPVLKSHFSSQPKPKAAVVVVKKDTVAAPVKRKRKKGKRAVITPELKEKVRAAVVAGKTGAQIVEEFGISLPSVGNIKREFGLTKKR